MSEPTVIACTPTCCPGCGRRGLEIDGESDDKLRGIATAKCWACRAEVGNAEAAA